MEAGAGDPQNKGERLLAAVPLADVGAQSEAVADQRLLDAALEASPVGFALVGLDGVLRRSNAEFRRIVGRENPVGLHVREFVTPDGQDDAQACLATLLRGETRRVTVVKDVLRPDGSCVTARLVCAAVLDDTGATAVLVAQLQDVGDERAARAALEASERHYRFIAENSADAITHHLPDGPVLWASRSAVAVFGYSLEELAARPFRERVHPEDAEPLGALVSHLVHGLTEVVDTRYRWQLPDGNWRWLHSRIKAAPNAEGFVGETVGVTRDVDAEVRAEQLLSRAYEETAAARALMETALNATSEPFAVWNVSNEGPAGTWLEMANDAVEQVLPGARHEVVGRTLSQLYPPPLDDLAAETHAMFQTTLRAGSPVVGEDQPARGGSARVFRPTLSPIGHDRVAVVMRDVTDEVHAVQRLARERDMATDAARRDTLTGLHNRLGLREKLAEALETRREGSSIAVVFIDLDKFKAVNDTYGHDAGDILLLAVAGRLDALVRDGDTAARFGGDEFVLVLRGLPGDWDETSFEQRAMAAVGEPVEVRSGVLVDPSASFGVVLVPADEADPDTVLASADQAMYRAKSSRRHSAHPGPAGHLGYA